MLAHRLLVADFARAVQRQQQASAHHVAQRAIGLLPLPDLTQLSRQLPPAHSRMRGDHLPDETDLGSVDLAAPVSHSRSMRQIKSERKHFVLAQLTFLHTGAAGVSGLPAASSNWA